MKTKALDMLPVKECRKLNMSKANTALLSEESKFFSICNCTGSSSSALVVDEFTVPCEKSKELHDCKQIIEGLFKVTFCLEQHFSRFSLDGSDDKLSRVWVQLNGAKVAVEKAKEYMKGFCEPEFEEEESYPRDMHCIFVGADRLFLDCLIRDTCADVAVSELGSLHIRGGAEAVVMARSQIQQFVKLFKNNQSLPSEVETFIKKQFKIFVEDHADKYTMDLLLLPSSLKKELLNLAGRFEPIKTEHEVVDLTEPCDTHVTSTTSVKIEAVEVTEHTLEQTRKQAGTPVTELTNQIDLMLSDIPKEESNQEVGSIPCQESSDSQEKLPCKRRYSGSEGRLRKRPYSVEQSQCSPLKLNDSTDLEDSLLELDCSSESDSSVIFVEDWVDVKPEKEYKILVDFFKTMGYSQDLVEQVIKRVGQLEEPLLLLEHIEKESKKCQGRTEIHSDISDSLDYSSEIYSGNKLQTRAVGVNTECRAKTSTLAAKEEMTDVKCSTSRPQENSSSDGTCKSSSAAVSNSMGSAIPKNSKTVVNLQCSPVIEIDDLETDGASFPSCTAQNSKVDFKERTEFIARGSSSSACRHSDQVLVETAAVGQKSAVPEREHSSRPTEKYQVAVSRPSDQQSIEEHELLHQEPIIYSRPPIKRPLQVQDSVITGSQRFFDLIKTPYNLKLRNEPGKPYLKHIIIDGSNVAMAHGLSKIFSCRGIAIAVEHFWNRGHRNITVFVPQWRTKRDPNITEQLFLTQLKELGVLSFTPARTVCGERIAAHDDRFLLHLSEKTQGIIVTNDNLKEFVIESPIWKHIIKTRLLQFTFAGDIFMLPDDPLGRHGPNLEQFLCNEDYARTCPPTHSVMMHGGNARSENPTATSSSLPLCTPNALLLAASNQFGSQFSQVRPEMRQFPLQYQAVAPTALQQPPPQRSAKETEILKQALLRIFPENQQKQKIDKILTSNPYMRDMNALSAMILD